MLALDFLRILVSNRSTVLPVFLSNLIRLYLENLNISKIWFPLTILFPACPRSLRSKKKLWLKCDNRTTIISVLSNNCVTNYNNKFKNLFLKCNVDLFLKEGLNWNKRENNPELRSCEIRFRVAVKGGRLGC